MSWLKIRGNVYFACWKNAAGEEVRKSTKVHVKPTSRDAGMSAKDLKKIAERCAEAMEASSKTGLSLELALQSVRATATGRSVNLVTCKSFSVAFLNSKRKQKSFNTIKAGVESFFRLMPGAADLPLSRFTPAMADDYIGRALDEVSGSTVHRRREVLSSMFNRAVAEKLIDENPFRSTRVPQWAMNEAREREPFEPREIQRILAELPGEWPDMVAVCLLLGGLRLSDVATLKWEKIDFERGLVQVKDQKNNKPRRKPLIKPLRNIFERRRKVGGEWSPYVFPYAQIRYAEAGDKSLKLSIEFGKLLQEHKIVSPPLEDDRRAGTDRHFQPKTFHSLRTTSTTFLLDVGCPPELVRHIIGHDDPAIERAHYYKPTSETQQNYIKKLAELLNLGDV